MAESLSLWAGFVIRAVKIRCLVNGSTNPSIGSESKNRQDFLCLLIYFCLFGRMVCLNLNAKRKHLFKSEQNLRFSSAFLNILKCTPKLICSCVVMHVRRDRYDVV